MKRTIFIILVFIALSPASAVSSESVGTIDPVAHSTTICQNQSCSIFGNINWKPTITASTTGASPIIISDTGLSGFLWGDQIGWVNMAPSSGGVTINPNTGAISGYAFSNTGGWINFRPTQVAGNPTVGVSINASGEFSGYSYVSGIRGGWMKFDCTVPGTCVKTDWRPLSVRTLPSASGGGGGGGGPTATIPTLSQSAAAVIVAVNISYNTNRHSILVSWVTDIPTTGEVIYIVDGMQGGAISVIDSGGLNTLHVVEFAAPTGVHYLIRIVAHSSESRDSESAEYYFSTYPNAVAMPISRDVVPDPEAPKSIEVDSSEILDNIEVGSVDISPDGKESNGSIGGGVVTPIPPIASTHPRPVGFFWMLISIVALLFKPLAKLVQIGSLGDARLVASRLFNVLTFRKRRIVDPWGTVYDSVTKRPLDPAYVSLISTVTGEEVKGAITDMEGRYGFLVEAGEYKILASKTHYDFPSHRLIGKTSDPVYEKLYFGERIFIKDNHEVIRHNIPLDPVGVDWNEEEKKRMGIGGARRRRQIFVSLLNTFFLAGFLFSVVVFSLEISWLNGIIVLLYALIWIGEVLWRRRFHVTQVKRGNGAGIAFAVIKLSFANSGMVVKKVVADENGYFYLLVTPGTYKLEVAEKTSDEVYMTIHEVESIKLPKGILLQDIIV